MNAAEFANLALKESGAAHTVGRSVGLRPNKTICF